MFITTHAVVGALIGGQLPQAPVLVFFLSLLSHFLADIIPHGDSKLYKGYVAGTKTKRAVAYVTLDALVTLLGVLALFNTRFIDHRLAISLGILGGVLPDLLVAIYEVFRIKELQWFHKLHFFFHNLIITRKGDMPLTLGIAMQVSILLIIIVRVL